MQGGGGRAELHGVYVCNTREAVMYAILAGWHAADDRITVCIVIRRRVW